MAFLCLFFEIPPVLFISLDFFVDKASKKIPKYPLSEVNYSKV
jgi:hypothetical protein